MKISFSEPKRSNVEVGYVSSYRITYQDNPLIPDLTKTMFNSKIYTQRLPCLSIYGVYVNFKVANIVQNAEFSFMIYIYYSIWH